MLESLLVLLVASLIAMCLTSSVSTSFTAVEEQIFFMEFESFYRETQKQSLVLQEKTRIDFSDRTISNGRATLRVPASITSPSNQTLHFDKAGGNSSLASVSFQTRQERIRYQLYLGNGKIKRVKEQKD